MEKVKRKIADRSQPVERKYKDTVFRMIFREKEELLGLFNAVNGTDYREPDELEINTLENAIYMSMKNDLSCVLDLQLNLYEHQSTVNPNMPLRDLFYTARLYEGMLRERQIYSSVAVKLPAPKFVVFYNGEEPQPERKVLRLSDLYARKQGTPNLELSVLQLNINPGFNEELKRNCPTLSDYMVYVSKVRDYSKYMDLESAVEKAVTECIKEGILAEFLKKNRTEVIQMSIFEYDQEAHMKQIREEGIEEAKKMYIEASIASLRAFSISDKDILEQLVKRYHLSEKEAMQFMENR